MKMLVHLFEHRSAVESGASAAAVELPLTRARPLRRLPARAGLMASLANRLRDRLSSRRRSTSTMGQGGRDESLAAARRRRRAAEQARGRGLRLVRQRGDAAGIERAVNQWRVTIRRRDDITPSTASAG
jgi:hypothetical protein